MYTREVQPSYFLKETGFRETDKEVISAGE